MDEGVLGRLVAETRGNPLADDSAGRHPPLSDQDGLNRE
jgi:hypothetical protein